MENIIHSVDNSVPNSHTSNDITNTCCNQQQVSQLCLFHNFNSKINCFIFYLVKVVTQGTWRDQRLKKKTAKKVKIKTIIYMKHYFIKLLGNEKRIKLNSNGRHPVCCILYTSCLKYTSPLRKHTAILITSSKLQTKKNMSDLFGVFSSEIPQLQLGPQNQAKFLTSSRFCSILIWINC